MRQRWIQLRFRLLFFVLTCSLPGLNAQVLDDSGMFQKVGEIPTEVNPMSVAYSPLLDNGNLFAAVVSVDFSNNTGKLVIYGVDKTTGLFTPLATSSTYSNAGYPRVAFSPQYSKNLFVAFQLDSEAHAIPVYQVEIETEALTLVPGAPFASPGYSSHEGFAFSSNINGKLFASVTNQYDNNSSVYDVDPLTGFFTAVDGFPFPSQGSRAYGVAYSPLIEGKSFAAVTNFYSKNVAVYQVDSATGVWSPVLNSPFKTGLFPGALAYSSYINTIYTKNLTAAICNGGSNTISIYDVDLSTGVFNEVEPSPIGTGDSPSSIAFSPMIDDGGLSFAAVSHSPRGTLGSASIYYLNPGTGLQKIQEVSTGYHPECVAFSPVVDRKLFLSISNQGSDTVSIYQLKLKPDISPSVSPPEDVTLTQSLEINGQRIRSKKVGISYLNVIRWRFSQNIGDPVVAFRLINTKNNKIIKEISNTGKNRFKLKVRTKKASTLFKYALESVASDGLVSFPIKPRVIKNSRL